MATSQGKSLMGEGEGQGFAHLLMGNKLERHQATLIKGETTSVYFLLDQFLGTPPTAHLPLVLECLCHIST